MASKRKKKTEVTWVTMGPDPHFATCNRCGEHIPAPPLPMRVEAFVKYGEYQTELHRYCEEVPAKEPESTLNNQQPNKGTHGR